MGGWEGGGRRRAQTAHADRMAPATWSPCPALPPAGRHHRLAARERRHGVYQRLLLVLGGLPRFWAAFRDPL